MSQRGGAICTGLKARRQVHFVSMDLLYEKLAGELSESIARGVLRPGDRLPSVRLLARQRKVSVATVLS